MSKRMVTVKGITIGLLVTGISLLHFITPPYEYHYHIFYRELYFVPLLLAGLWFGLRGGILTSSGITFLYLIHIISQWEGFSSNDLNNLTEIALYNAVGVILGLLVDRERADQRRLREAESLTAIGKALLGVAHDMKTPLIAIGGFARSVQKRMDRTNPDHKKLDIVLAETERLERMIKGMLDFSRPLTLDQSREDLNKAIMESLPIVENVAAEKEVKVESRIEEGPLLVNSDQRRMKQVIINLLINAIEASGHGETVTVCSRRDRENVILEVSDHGCGIPGEQKQEVFIPFFSTKKGGTGLGLAIAKKVVDAHGGEIFFRPNQGGGTTFAVRLPVASW